MIDHIGIEVADFSASCTFYDRVLSVIDARLLARIPLEYTNGVSVAGYGQDRPTFWISEGTGLGPNLHICFQAQNRAQVSDFYEAALAAGGACNGAPGLRPHYHDDYFAAFVHDPDGHNIEMVCHTPE